MRHRVFAISLVGLFVLVSARSDALAGTSQRGGGYINLIVREVTAAPVRAHVGDVITVGMTVEDQGDLYYSNIEAEVRANGKVVARKLVTYGFGEGSRVQKGTYQWDTRGMAPGEYRIRGEVFVWYDSSPFDNFLDLGEPVVLLPPGAPFADGKGPGGTAVSTDPRWKGSRLGASGDDAPPAPRGY